MKPMLRLDANPTDDAVEQDAKKPRMGAGLRHEAKSQHDAGRTG